MVSPPKARSSTSFANSASIYFQATKRVIERENRDVGRCGRPSCFIDGDELHTKPPFSRTPTAGVIDEYSTHDVRGHGEKVSPIPPVNVTLVDESQIHLVNQGGRLQSVANPFFVQLTRRDAPQLRIDKRQQLIERTVVAATPIIEERRDIMRRGHRCLQRARESQDRRPPTLDGEFFLPV